MDPETFYRRLVDGLTQAGFHLQAGDRSQDGLSSDSDSTLATIRRLTGPVGRLVPNFDQDVIRRHLDMVRTWAIAACFKFTLAQPIMLAVVEADRLSEDDILKLKQRFDQVVIEMSAVSGKLDVGGPGRVRLGSCGILLFVFFDPQAAARFTAHTQRKCKRFHLFKKVYVLPWLIDVANRTVKKHRGIPFFMSTVLNTDTLQKQLFGESAGAG